MDILNWGLIGAGDIVWRRVAPALAGLENCEFAAVSRERSELAAGFSNRGLVCFGALLYAFAVLVAGR